MGKSTSGRRGSVDIRFEAFNFVVMLGDARTCHQENRCYDYKQMGTSPIGVVWKKIPCRQLGEDRIQNICHKEWSYLGPRGERDRSTPMPSAHAPTGVSAKEFLPFQSRRRDTGGLQG